MAVNSLVDALEEGRSVHYGELVLWVLQVLEHKHSGDNSILLITDGTLRNWRLLLGSQRATTAAANWLLLTL